MKKFIWLILLILLTVSCVKFDKLGMPIWDTEFQVNILNDSYDVNQVADYDSSLYVENNVLRFRTTLSDSVSYNDVTIQHPVEKSVSVSLSSLSEDLEQYNGTQTVVPTFHIDPLQEDVPNYNEFQEITFGAAQIKFTIRNQSDIYLGNFPDDPLIISLKNRNTGALVYQYFVEENIPPQSDHIAILDLTNYTFPNTLALQLEGGSIGSDGEVITVDISQYVEIILELLDFKIKHVIAHIPYQELSDHTITKPLSITFPQIIGSFDIASNSSINFNISSPIPATTYLKLISVSPDGESDTLKVNGAYPTIYNVAGVTDTTFYSSNSNLNDLLTLLPEKFIMILHPAVGDSTDNIYEINSDDMTKMTVTIDTDLNLNADCWVIPRDDNNPRITASNTESFTENQYKGFINGGLKLKFDNRTGTQLGLDLLAATGREYLNDFDKIVNPDTSNVTIFSIPVIVTGKDSVDFVINKEDLEVFLPDSVFIVPRIKLISQASEPLANGLDIQAKVHMKVRISKDLLSTDE